MRIGILADGDSLAPWQASLANDLAAAGDVPILIKCVSKESTGGLAATLWRLAARVERPTGPIIHHRSFIRAGRDSMGPSKLDPAAEASLAGSDSGPIDLVLDLRAAGDGVTQASPRLGVIRVLAGAVNAATGRADGTVEFSTRRPITTLALRYRPAPGEPERELTRQFRTYLQSWSESLRRQHWRAALFLRDVIADYRRRGAESWLMTAPPAATEAAGAAGLASAVAALPRAGWRTALTIADRLAIHDQWRIPITTTYRTYEDVANYAAWDAIVPPPDRMWADPFVKVVDGRIHVFVEEVMANVGRGTIACLAYDNGRATRLGTVLDLPYHLSYPFLLEHEGALYMLPESSEDRALHVWRCVEFPLRWEKVATMLKGLSIADSTILFDQGRWWLFGNIDRLEVGAHTNELHVFFADNPIDGSWQPHPLNPVIVDDRFARMAGTLERVDGRLLRFAQGSARYYGETLEVREVTTLSPTDFADRRLLLVGPDVKGGGSGVHHFTHDGSVAVVDAFYKIPRLGWRGVVAPLVRALS